MRRRCAFASARESSQIEPRTRRLAATRRFRCSRARRLDRSHPEGRTPLAVARVGQQRPVSDRSYRGGQRGDLARSPRSDPIQAAHRVRGPPRPLKAPANRPMMRVEARCIRGRNRAPHRIVG
jgi:hypothetical protein